MKQPPNFQRQLRSALIAVALFCIPLALISVYLLIRDEFSQSRILRDTAEQTVQTRDELAQLLALHLDLETGVRGYVITGDDRFLAPYERALRNRDAVFRSLMEDADPKLRRDLAGIRILSDAKLANATRNVEDVRRGLSGQARQRVASGLGRDIMDDIRSRIATIDANEARKLSDLTRAGAGAPDGIERSINLLLLGIVILLGFVTLVVGRTNRHRRLALERVGRLAERQRIMFDGAVDGMLWLDETGHILRLNPSICRMFGYKEQDLLGQHNMALMQDAFTMEQSLAWLATVGEAGAHGAGRRQEFTGLRTDGTTFETEVAISRVGEDFDPGDKDAPRYIATIRDISHRKRAERLKTEFVSTVSHELRTPLTSIAGSLGLVLGGATGSLPENTRRLINIAHANCERLIRLINDILDIEKIESGKMEFDIRRMQVAPLVRRTQDAMAGFADQHGVGLVVEMPPWPQCIMGDPDRLDQLLTNLASNAIKHAPQGSTVEIACVQQGRFARIEVRDRGAGIPLSFRDRIFGKFAMADAADNRTRGGTGLGLSIAREIAHRHGGEVGFADREGGGTVFHVDLPLASDQPEFPTTAAPNLPLVLHLDDDADCLSVVASAFEGKAQILSATTLQEARVLVSERRLGAAIIDIGLGPDSGLALVAELRRLDGQIPIVLFTAIDSAADTHAVDRLLVKSRASIADLVSDTLALISRREEAAA